MSGDSWVDLVLVVVGGVVLVLGWTVARRPLPPGALLADRARQVRRQQGRPVVVLVELFLVADFVLSLRSR